MTTSTHSTWPPNHVALKIKLDEYISPLAFPPLIECSCLICNLSVNMACYDSKEIFRDVFLKYSTLLYSSLVETSHHSVTH